MAWPLTPLRGSRRRRNPVAWPGGNAGGRQPQHRLPYTPLGLEALNRTKPSNAGSRPEPLRELSLGGVMSPAPPERRGFGLGNLRSSRDVSVRLQERLQALVCLLQRFLKFNQPFCILLDAASIEVRDYLKAKVYGARNSFRNQAGVNAFFFTLHLPFPRLLHRSGYGLHVIDRVPKFLQKPRIYALREQDLLQALQLYAGSLYL